MKNRVATGLYLLLFCCCLLHTGALAATIHENGLQLSDDTLKYLQEKQILRVSVITNWRPLSFQDNMGTIQGVSIAILETLSELSGITVELIPAQSYEESNRQLLAGEVDLCGLRMGYPVKPQNMAELEQIQLIPYLSSQIALIRHKDTDLAHVPNVLLADVAGRAGFTYNQTTTTIFYQTQGACLNAVRSGQVDIAVCDMFTSSVLMQQYNTRDLVSNATTIMTEMGFGVLAATDIRLISALETSIKEVSRYTVNQILTEGSIVTGWDVAELIYHYPVEIICFSFAMMFVILLSMHVYTKIRLRHHQSLQGYEESYRLLSDIFGDAAVEYDYLNDQMIILGEKSNLDIEHVVDDFHEKLRTNAIRMSLTVAQFDALLVAGAEGTSFSTELQCGVKSGDWTWYRLIYTVICTSESHRRPIRLVGCLANIDEEHTEKERLMQLSLNDQLTGLYNRAAAEHYIQKRLSACDEDHVGMMIVVDIDYFKRFNDKMGHFCGDDVLRSFGHSARECCLPTDILCRWGGDEFLLFLEESPENTPNDRQIRARFERLCERMRRYGYKGTPCPVTLSAGGARSYSGCTFESLFEQADKALYQAKKYGRNRLCLSTFTVQNKTQQREMTES